jgi:prefoldin subunit 5
MGASKQDFTEQRQYEGYTKQDLEDGIEIMNKRIAILKSTIESQNRIIDSLEQTLLLVRENHKNDIKLNYKKK